jgi:hypothetical protein
VLPLPEVPVALGIPGLVVVDCGGLAVEPEGPVAGLAELCANTAPDVPIMEIRTARVNFFMLSPYKKWIALQTATGDKYLDLDYFAGSSQFGAVGLVRPIWMGGKA